MHILFVCQVWFGVGGVARADLPVSLIHIHMPRNTQTHLADSSAVKSVQVNAQEGPRDRASEPRGDKEWRRDRETENQKDKDMTQRPDINSRCHQDRSFRWVEMNNNDECTTSW